MSKTTNPMPKMIRLLPACLLAGALLLSGCQTTQLTISPIPANTMGENPEILVDQQTHRVSVELLTPNFSRKFEELPTFSIYVENLADKYILFSSAGIKLTSGGQLVPSYSIDEYAQLLQDETERDSQEYSARQAEVALQGTPSQENPDNSAAMAKISAAKRANRGAARREATTRILEATDSLISIHQINAGESHRGLAKFHADGIQADQPLKLMITLAGETYTFDFEVSSDES